VARQWRLFSLASLLKPRDKLSEKEVNDKRSGNRPGNEQRKNTPRNEDETLILHQRWSSIKMRSITAVARLGAWQRSSRQKFIV
jgi:hypothetical protein